MDLRFLPASPNSVRRDPNLPYYLVTAVLIMGYGSVLTLLAEFRRQFGFSESELGGNPDSARFMCDDAAGADNPTTFGRPQNAEP